MYEIPIYAVRLIQEGTLSLPLENLSGPADAAQVISAHLGDMDREHFVAVFLNTKKVPIGFHTISVGSLNSAVVHPREVFKAAILANACAIIVGHNHPAGSLIPSTEDRNVTLRLVEAGRVIGIDVLDHVIVAPGGGWVSFKGEGWL